VYNANVHSCQRAAFTLPLSTRKSRAISVESLFLFPTFLSLCPFRSWSQSPLGPIYQTLACTFFMRVCQGTLAPHLSSLSLSLPLSSHCLSPFAHSEKYIDKPMCLAFDVPSRNNQLVLLSRALYAYKHIYIQNIFAIFRLILYPSIERLLIREENIIPFVEVYLSAILCKARARDVNDSRETGEKPRTSYKERTCDRQRLTFSTFSSVSRVVEAVAEFGQSITRMKLAELIITRFLMCA
jgi:hypothetical protein